MNWFSENKFMAGFIGFMVVGVGALGYLLATQISDFSQKQADYSTKYRALDELQKKNPFPNQKNLEAFQSQHEELKGDIDALNQNLAKIQFPIDSTVTPKTFQENLQAAIADANAKATANKVVLPDKFALGFDNYVSTLSIAGAAPALDRQLKAAEIVFDELLNGPGVANITDVSRGKLAEENEGEKEPAKPAGKPGAKTPAGGQGSGNNGQVIKTPLQITFTADWSTLRRIMNDIVQSNKQFFIIRLVNIKTDGSKDQPITKVDAAKTGSEAMQKGEPAFVLGDNVRLTVTLSLEIVNFNPPPSK